MTRQARNLAAAKRVWSNLRSRCRKIGQTLPDRQQVIKLVLAAIGKPCHYCLERIAPKNASIDHEVPVERGGTSAIGNLRVITKKCNTRKGNLTGWEYWRLLRHLEHELGPEAKRYVLTKLSSAPRGWWGK